MICKILFLPNDLRPEIYLAHEYFLIINNRKITSLKDYMMRKIKNCVKAETKTYKVQKPIPNTSADLCTLSVSICLQFQFLYMFRYLVFKS